MPRRRKPVNTTTLDKFGRVLLPKPLRDRVGIRPGDDLRVKVREGSLVLEPVRGEIGITTERGWPVLTEVDLAPGFEWKDLIRRDREDRIRQIWNRGRKR
ncbi:MAG TPA: AbrB/MazE/SpoVT family DNA-binding domain-containing protein [Planctomycetota bacterium]|nr:AbrB/MazE/SpoVT family DNA-binding domain-containing protein [Planctomycetota bacterium]